MPQETYTVISFYCFHLWGLRYSEGFHHVKYYLDKLKHSIFLSFHLIFPPLEPLGIDMLCKGILFLSLYRVQLHSSHISFPRLQISLDASPYLLQVVKWCHWFCSWNFLYNFKVFLIQYLKCLIFCEILKVFGQYLKC